MAGRCRSGYSSRGWYPPPYRPRPYIGGKRRLGEQLARRIEAVVHDTHAEPFVGMGGLFFRWRWAPRREVVNDVSRDVATRWELCRSIVERTGPRLKSRTATV